MAKPEFKVALTPEASLVVTNCLYLPPGTLQGARRAYMRIAGSRGAPDFVFTVEEHEKIGEGQIGLSTMQRKCTKLSVHSDTVPLDLFTPPSRNFTLVSMRCEIDFSNPKKAAKVVISATRLAENMHKTLANQVFAVDQIIPLEYEGTVFQLTVTGLDVLNEDKCVIEESAATGGFDPSAVKPIALLGMLAPDTSVFVEKAAGQAMISLVDLPKGQEKMIRGNLFKGGFNFEKCGIGGLDGEADQLFRRAFASRVFPPSYLAKLGISHVKGILLFGPPGCGKTLMARQIGQMLNCKKPKVVDGPSIMSKFVGESEQNVRKLFEDAEREQAQRGDESDLHLIIFDEFDAIVKQRGSTRDGTGVGDSVVNQLLAKIDGVEQLNNVLLVGMTNRKDLIDEALLRPGRFEVQIEINLPDKRGRRQIFGIHTTKASQNGLLGSDVDLDALAAQSKNYTGAEIEGVVKAASSFALHRLVDLENPQKVVEGEATVSMADFVRAMDDVKPAFGAAKDITTYKRNGIFDYGAIWRQQLDACLSYVSPLKTGGRTQVVSVLLEGVIGAGKTALAAHIAELSGFPFVKILTMEDMIGMFENTRVNVIRKAFDDAHKSPYSVIVLDELERLIEYVSVGQRFSNVTLQALMVLMKKLPPEGRRILVIGTTSALSVMQDDLEFAQHFDVVHNVPQLRSDDVKSVLSEMGCTFASAEDQEKAISCMPQRIAMKKLVLVGEMAQALAQGSDMPGLVDERSPKGSAVRPAITRHPLTAQNWSDALENCGISKF
eukprot:TRINITY_DN944_c1_g1_i1.p1 TRINITY_DN944_c1_g1~~TRINITY_DN944_c1_g1_i1.p1  ORF type:complete len:776 (+),score=283.89 TRINITY_DN944_c1_g1_i1:82-2409(+)